MTLRRWLVLGAVVLAAPVLVLPGSALSAERREREGRWQEGEGFSGWSDWMPSPSPSATPSREPGSEPAAPAGEATPGPQAQSIGSDAGARAAGSQAASQGPVALAVTGTPILASQSNVLVVDDPDDVPPGALDLKQARHSTEGDQVVYEAEMYDPFTTQDVGEVVWAIELDGDPQSEGCINVRRIGAELRVLIFGPGCSGVSVGEGAVTRSGQTLRVTYPVQVLRTLGVTGSSYRLRIVVNSGIGAQLVTDRAPDDGSFVEHVLSGAAAGVTAAPVAPTAAPVAAAVPNTNPTAVRPRPVAAPPRVVTTGAGAARRLPRNGAPAGVLVVLGLSLVLGGSVFVRAEALAVRAICSPLSPAAALARRRARHLRAARGVGLAAAAAQECLATLAVPSPRARVGACRRIAIGLSAIAVVLSVTAPGQSGIAQAASTCWDGPPSLCRTATQRLGDGDVGPYSVEDALTPAGRS